MSLGRLCSWVVGDYSISNTKSSWGGMSIMVCCLSPLSLLYIGLSKMPSIWEVAGQLGLVVIYVYQRSNIRSIECQFCGQPRITAIQEIKREILEWIPVHWIGRQRGWKTNWHPSPVHSSPQFWPDIHRLESYENVQQVRLSVGDQKWCCPFKFPCIHTSLASIGTGRQPHDPRVAVQGLCGGLSHVPQTAK